MLTQGKVNYKLWVESKSDKQLKVDLETKEGRMLS